MAKKSDWTPDPIKHALAAKSLRESLIATFGDDADEDMLTDAVEGETDLYEKLDELIFLRSVALAQAEGLKRYFDDLKARQERFEKRADSLKAIIEQAMVVAEIPKLERPVGTLSMSQRPPQVIIVEEADIPPQFWRKSDPTLDKKALADALKERRRALESLPAPEAPDYSEAVAAIPAEIAGAILSNGSQSLTIRVK